MMALRGRIVLPAGAEEHIDLLANVDSAVGFSERVDNLKHPRIDALGVIAGQRFLRDDVGLDAHEAQGVLLAGLAARDGLG